MEEAQQAAVTTPTEKGDNTGCWIAGILGCGCLLVLLVSAVLTGILFFLINPQQGNLSFEPAENHSTEVLQAELTPTAMPESFWQRPESLAETTRKNKAELDGTTHLVQALVLNDGFENLDDLANRMRTNQKRSYSGNFTLETYYTAIYQLQSNNPDDKHLDYRSLYDTLTRWHLRNQDNITPYVAVMRQSYENAWLWRGSAYKAKVGWEAQQRFKQNLQFAEKHLKEAAKLEHNDPAYYRDAVKVGLGLAYPRRKVRAFVEKSRDIDAGFFPTYSAYAIFLLPRWYGDNGSEVVHFTNEATEWSRAEWGESAYAWIAYRVATYGGMDIDTFFEEYPFSWPRIQQGFVDWDAKYPLDDEVMNTFAWLAVAANDRDTAARLFTVIGENYNAEVWKKRDRFDRARNWALQ